MITVRKIGIAITLGATLGAFAQPQNQQQQQNSGGGSGFNVQLLTTDLMPSTDFTEVSALLLTVISSATPLNVAVTLVTAPVRPETLIVEG